MREKILIDRSGRVCDALLENLDYSVRVTDDESYIKNADYYIFADPKLSELIDSCSRLKSINDRVDIIVLSKDYSARVITEFVPGVQPFNYEDANLTEVAKSVRGYVHGIKREESTKLTFRERQVLKEIKFCGNDDAIARSLGLSTRTIRRIKRSVMDKIGLRRRDELVLYALRNGY